MEIIKCCQCGSTINLFKLKNEKYGCEKCLNELGKKQLDIANAISELLENFGITKINNKLKILDSTATYLAIKNNMNNQFADTEEAKELIISFMERGTFNE